MIHLEPVTPENWRCGLRVREDQRVFAADSAGLLARACVRMLFRSSSLMRAIRAGAMVLRLSDCSCKG